MRAVAFDLGDTLVEYEGLPLSWEAHYGAAVEALARHLGAPIDEAKIGSAEAVLRRYNTRLVPRSREIEFGEVLHEVLNAIGVVNAPDTASAAAAFFSVFRQKLRCFADTRECLGELRRRGFRVGVLTDVPYGMPRNLVIEDMAAAGVDLLVDEVVTSVDAGLRKPSAGGLELLARRLQAQAHEMIFVGNEKKDIDVALAYGCEAVLLDRKGLRPNWSQHRTLSTLAEL